MKKILLLKLLLVTYILSGQNITVIKGFVKNIDRDTLIIAKSDQDFRYNGTEIPVQKDKLFKYYLKNKFVEEYSIIYKSDLKKGFWRPIIFFSNGQIIEFELYPTHQFKKNKIIGDSLRIQKIKYQIQFGKKFSKKGNEIYGNLFQLKKGGHAYKKAMKSIDSLNRIALSFQYYYFQNNKSILGLNEYVHLLKNANQMMISSELFKEYQQFYSARNTHHPLIKKAKNLFKNLSKISTGQQYIDVTLIDRNNDYYKLSSLILKKKYTLLDLWSPWCGTCIKKSKLLKKTYSKLLNNTQIIGVVGGINKTSDAEKALNKFDYPWENFIEVSSKNKIWEKYKIQNSGGAQFLINNKGEILAINPKLDEFLKIVNRI